MNQSNQTDEPNNQIDEPNNLTDEPNNLTDELNVYFKNIMIKKLYFLSLTLIKWLIMHWETKISAFSSILTQNI